MKINVVMQKLGKFLYPDVCLHCNDKGEYGLDLCRRCYENLPWITHACMRCASPLPNASAAVCGFCSNRDLYFDRALAPLLFDQFVRDAVYQFKFNGKFNYGILLARLLERHIRKQDLVAPDVLVPVPLHRRRLRKRGFNQALQIARVLNKSVNSSISFKDIRRVRETRAQMELPATERYMNVRGAFALQTSKPLFKGKRVAIIDDVMTTGNTMNELARCLKEAGAEQVYAWCVARTKLND